MLIILILFPVLIILGVFYFKFDPQSNFFPKCPFKYVTGYDCPGCGSQRAVHEILHGNFKKAFLYNPLLIISLPYVLIGILFEWFSLKYKYPKTRQILFGRNATYFVGVVIILFSILRNL